MPPSNFKPIIQEKSNKGGKTEDKLDYLVSTQFLNKYFNKK